MSDPSTLPVGPLPERIGAHFFASIFDTRGRAWHGPLLRFVSRLATFPVHAGVSDNRTLPTWSPRIDWTQPDGAFVHALVLDVDGGATIDEALARCSAWAFVLHSTWSHSDTAPRFRVVLPLARAVPTDGWEARWRVATASIGLPMDGCCKDHRRRYLLPASSGADSPTHGTVHLDRPALDLLPIGPPRHCREAVGPRSRLRIPWHVADRVRAARLRVDPESRRNVAALLQLSLSSDGNRATGALCPACGRPSVWFLVSPQRASNARCNHANSCGWTGPLTHLLAG